jgi:hypothetical protein
MSYFFISFEKMDASGGQILKIWTNGYFRHWLTMAKSILIIKHISEAGVVHG